MCEICALAVYGISNDGHRNFVVVYSNVLFIPMDGVLEPLIKSSFSAKF